METSSVDDFVGAGAGANSPRRFVDRFAAEYMDKLAGVQREGESAIEEMLERGVASKDDVGTILEWVTGRRREESEIPARRPISIDEVFDAVEKFNEGEKRLARELVFDLNDVFGVGPVYASAVLYCASRGRYPIYSFPAYAALTALREGRDAGDGCVAERARINGENWFESYERDYKSFFDGLVEPEGENAELLRYLAEHYWENRDVDRALWAYGRSLL